MIVVKNYSGACTGRHTCSST